LVGAGGGDFGVIDRSVHNGEPVLIESVRKVRPSYGNDGAYTGDDNDSYQRYGFDDSFLRSSELKQGYVQKDACIEYGGEDNKRA